MRKKQPRLYRQLMENHLERVLSFNEVVHHINGDRSDDRLENLQLMTREEHGRYHGTGERNPVYGKGGTFKGMSHSEEFKARLSVRMTGANNPMSGRTHSDEIRARLSKSSKERLRTDSERIKRSKMMSGEGNPMYGKKASDKTRRKMAMSHNARFGWNELTEEIKGFIVSEYIPRLFGVRKLSEKYNCSPKSISKYIRSDAYNK